MALKHAVGREMVAFKCDDRIARDIVSYLLLDAHKDPVRLVEWLRKGLP